jgi:hypothetical protein
MPLGTDEEVGRAILANLAWGAAREAFGRADELAKMQPSHSSVSRADAARAEVARTSELFNETLAAIGLGPFLADDEWFLPVDTPATLRVRQSVQRVTDLLPALFNLDVVLSRHHRREVDPMLR